MYLYSAICLQCFDTVGWASGRASGLQKKLSDEVLVWLSVWSEVQIVCIWSSWCHCHPKTASSLAPLKSRLVLPFCYRLTQVVLEKRPLNGCSSSSSCIVPQGHNFRSADTLMSVTNLSVVRLVTEASASMSHSSCRLLPVKIRVSRFGRFFSKWSAIRLTQSYTSTFNQSSMICMHSLNLSRIWSRAITKS